MNLIGRLGKLEQQAEQRAGAELGTAVIRERPDGRFDTPAGVLTHEEWDTIAPERCSLTIAVVHE